MALGPRLEIRGNSPPVVRPEDGHAVEGGYTWPCPDETGG